MGFKGVGPCITLNLLNHICDCLICENIEKIDRGKECSDSTEDLEPVEEDEPLISESEPEDDASDDE